jgi:WD40 repeat protein
MPLTLERILAAHVEPRTGPRGAPGEPAVALGHSVRAIAFVDDENVFCGSDDHSASLWSVATGARRFVFTADRAHDTRCVAVSADGTRAITGHGSWGGACLWNLETGALIQQFDERLANVSAVGFFQPRVGDEEVIAYVGGGLFRWSVVTGAPVKAASAFGKQLPTAFSATQVLRVLPKATLLSSLPSEKTLRELDVVPRAQCAAFSRDGSRVGIGGDHGVLLVVDVESGAVQHRKEAGGGYKATIKALALHGDRVACGTQGGEVVLVEGGAVVAVVAVDSMAIGALSFSPRGDRLAVGCYDGNVRVFAVG